MKWQDEREEGRLISSAGEVLLRQDNDRVRGQHSEWREDVLPVAVLLR